MTEHRQTHAGRVAPLRSHAKLVLDDTTILNAHSVNLALGGASLIVSKSIPEAEPCVVYIDLYAKGAQRRICAKGKVVCCSCAGMEGFRISMRFTDLDEGSAATIDLLLQRAA